MQIEISKTVWQRIAIAAAVVLAVLGWAWWDGGEQAVHPIAQTVEFPEPAQ